jgi:predicted RND superfamily exporter protein
MIGNEFNAQEDYEYMETLAAGSPQVFALLTFEKPITAPMNSIVIASRLDIDVVIPLCFIFYLFIFYYFKPIAAPMLLPLVWLLTLLSPLCYIFLCIFYYFKPITALMNSIVIASRLGIDVVIPSCFYYYYYYYLF